MTGFNIAPIDIGGYIIDTVFSDDNRGCFIKLFECSTFQKEGIAFKVSESFISCSDKYVVRGMHFQTFHPQAKLVSVLKGKIYDVIVDLRKESITYGQWRGFYLSSENHKSLFVPRGFAHGFLSLCDGSTVLYQCDGTYDRKSDTGIMYNDKSISVEWPVNTSCMIVGERDRKLMSFEEFNKRHEFSYANLLD